MNRLRRVTLIMLALVALGALGKVTQAGSPAARVGDMHTCPLSCGTEGMHIGGPIITGSATVLICGAQAARLSDLATCVCATDVIAVGSATVLINGIPAARLNDATVHGGVIVVGCPTVLIGG